MPPHNRKSTDKKKRSKRRLSNKLFMKRFKPRVLRKFEPPYAVVELNGYDPERVLSMVRRNTSFHAGANTHGGVMYLYVGDDRRKHAELVDYVSRLSD